MNIKNQKRIAAKVLKVGKNRVKFDPTRVQDIKEAITRADIRGLVIDKFVNSIRKKGVSRGNARKILRQKRKGLRKGPGSRKGKATARLSRKETWMINIRSQRKFLKLLKDKKYISSNDYRNVYRKAKGGMFRSKRHLRLYLDEKQLLKKNEKK